MKVFFLSGRLFGAFCVFSNLKQKRRNVGPLLRKTEAVEGSVASKKCSTRFSVDFEGAFTLRGRVTGRRGLLPNSRDKLRSLQRQLSVPLSSIIRVRSEVKASAFRRGLKKSFKPTKSNGNSSSSRTLNTREQAQPNSTLKAASFPVPTHVAIDRAFATMSRPTASGTRVWMLTLPPTFPARRSWSCCFSDRPVPWNARCCRRWSPHDQTPAVTVTVPASSAG